MAECEPNLTIKKHTLASLFFKEKKENTVFFSYSVSSFLKMTDLINIKPKNDESLHDYHLGSHGVPVLW